MLDFIGQTCKSKLKSDLHISPKRCPSLFKCCPSHRKKMMMMSRSCCFHLLMCWSLNHLRKTAFSFSFPSLMLPYDLSSSFSQVNQTTPHYQPHPHQQHERCLQAPNHALLLRLLCPNTGTTSLPRQVDETRWFARLSSGMVYRVA